MHGDGDRHTSRMDGSVVVEYDTAIVWFESSSSLEMGMRDIERFREAVASLYSHFGRLGPDTMHDIGQVKRVSVAEEQSQVSGCTSQVLNRSGRLSR